MSDKTVEWLFEKPSSAMASTFCGVQDVVMECWTRAGRGDA